jgi:hypothetical protein
VIFAADAAKDFEAPGGRRIIWGWARVPGIQTLPRELSCERHTSCLPRHINNQNHLGGCLQLGRRSLQFLRGVRVRLFSQMIRYSGSYATTLSPSSRP